MMAGLLSGMSQPGGLLSGFGQNFSQNLPHILGAAGKALGQVSKGKPVDLDSNYQRMKADQARQEMMEALKNPAIMEGLTPQQQAIVKSMSPEQALQLIGGKAFGGGGDPKRYNVGGALVDAQGNVVYQGQDEQKAQSPLAKLAQDFRAGLIDKPTYEAMRSKMTAQSGGITIGPDGTVQIGGPALKEYEAKTTSYSRRMMESKPRVDAAEAALMEKGGPSLVDTTATGMGAPGNFVKSKEYQAYEAAGREWIAGLLRLDSGAAIPETEFTRYFATYFAAPGDTPETLELKRNARETVMRAVSEITPPNVKAQREQDGAAPSFTPDDILSEMKRRGLL